MPNSVVDNALIHHGTPQVDFSDVDVPCLSKNTGNKYDQGKPRFSLVPQKAMGEFVAVLTFGAEKYGDHNWKMVDGLQTRYFDALHRHLAAFRSGEVRDNESGKHHLAHAMCCLAFMLQNDLEGEL